MSRDKIFLRNIKAISSLSVEFVFPASNVLVITGKNGVGKTSIIKAFHLLSDPQIFDKASGLNSIRSDSEILFEIDGFDRFSFSVDKKRGVLDTRDKLPGVDEIIAELPIPYGERFEQFSLIASHDSEIRVSIASGRYNNADNLIMFLSEIYSTNKFDNLKAIKVGKNTFYFLLKTQDYYVREDHLSSGEFFLIQLYRLITSGAKLVLVDELDVALDAAAQVKLYAAIKPILKKYKTRLVVVSHSLAFMNTVDDGGLYYLEASHRGVVLEQRSFGYIKSDLYGFKGYDRYILTEDAVLEGFIEFVIRSFSIIPYYQYRIIGLAGVNQVKMILEKNDSDHIFSDSTNVMAVVDKDVFGGLCKDYSGETKIFCSPVDDLEKYIFEHRETLLPDIDLPTDKESEKLKKASKAYWKYLTIKKGINSNKLYELIIENNQSQSQKFADELQKFLVIG